MLKFESIEIKFENKILLSNFNYEIKKNDKIYLDGKSGTGKSSFLKMICGFVVPNSGKIYYNNEEVNSSNIRDFRKKISYISQGVDLPDKVVNDYINEIRFYSNNRTLFFEEKILHEYLYQFDLSENILSKNIKELSGGEKQRLSFIIAISLDRDILLLDEVSSGLDEDLKLKLVDFVGKLEKTVLIVSHDKHWSNIKNIRRLRW
jgi:putative ABC transport system ATP-binding protein